MRLDSKVALVTGAAGGIGSAIARRLAADGATLVLVDIARSGEDPTRGLAEELGATALSADVGGAADVRRMVEAAVARHGGLDILVNAAGVISRGAAATLPQEEWERVLRINLTGSFLCCQAAIPALRPRGGGRIVNIGSINAKTGGNARPWLDPGEQDQTANIAYNVSKAGVHALTLCLAKELAGQGITVNAVAPGPIASAMTTEFPETLRRLIPVGRMGTAADVAAAVAFLASDEAGFITGEILDVNGGMFPD